MTSTDVIQAVRDALKSDAALVKWCVDTYGRGPTVITGLDDSSPPKAEDYPVVVILGVDRERGEDAKSDVFHVDLGVGVVDGIVNETVHPNGATERTYRGAVNVEELREKAETALYGSRTIPMGTDAVSSSDSFFPVFVSYSRLTFRMLRSTRSGWA